MTNETSTTPTEPQPTERRGIAPAGFFYDVAHDRFSIETDSGRYIHVPAASAKEHLAARGYNTQKADGAHVSPAVDALIAIRTKKACDYVGPLAGWRAGYREQDGTAFLVTKSPRIIEPEPGEWPKLRELFESRLSPTKKEPEHGQAQLATFYGWVRIAYVALRENRYAPGQCLVLAGERQAGKNLLQDLITAILGGREASPFAYIRGATEFNAELFSAEHLVVADEMADADSRTRANIGARIKQIVANESQRIHRKGATAGTLKPRWRLSISLNDDPEDLTVLPDLGRESLEDKVTLLRVHGGPLPFDDDDAGDTRKRRMDLYMSELPHFLHWLENEFTIPAEMRDGRFGVRAWQHPEILGSCNEQSAHAELLRLVDLADIFPACTASPDASCMVARFGESGAQREPWQGTAEELGAELRDKLGRRAEEFLRWHRNLGRLLGRLAKDGDRVQAWRTRDARGWEISPPLEPSRATAPDGGMTDVTPLSQVPNGQTQEDDRCDTTSLTLIGRREEDISPSYKGLPDVLSHPSFRHSPDSEPLSPPLPSESAAPAWPEFTSAQRALWSPDIPEPGTARTAGELRELIARAQQQGNRFADWSGEFVTWLRAARQMEEVAA